MVSRPPHPATSPPLALGIGGFILTPDCVLFSLSLSSPFSRTQIGIDIDSTRDVVVQNTMVDSNDDMLCVKSGAGFLGRQAAVPSQNILFQDCEIRSGHGLTLGSEMSGGVRCQSNRPSFVFCSASDLALGSIRPDPVSVT